MSIDTPDLNSRILVIDDMAEIHTAFRRLLCPRVRPPEAARLESSLFGSESRRREVAFEVDVALQGQEGLRLVQAALDAGRPYAMAFIDMRMPPGWDGLQTIEEIWKVYPDLEVVICTAYSDYSDSDIVARLGATDQILFLRKPFDPIEVRQLARALTEKWTLRQHARLHTAELERRVATRVRELTSANTRLVEDIAYRQTTERELQRARNLHTVQEVTVAQARELEGSLRTLITSMAQVRLIVASDLDPVGIAMNAATQVAGQMAGLVSRLASFATPEDPHVAIDLDAAVADVVAIMRDGIDADTTLELDLHPLPQLPGSATDVRLALIGLVDNALQAVEFAKRSTAVEGRITISTRLDDDTAVIAISDSGHALSDALRGRIFQPWFVPNEGERSSLAFASRVVAQHHGNVTIDNGAAGGVTVSVRLPVSSSPG